MPVRNDFRCEVCGYWAEYWATRATAPSHCGQAMTWAPTRSAAVDSREPFHKFEVEVGGSMRRVESLHDIRRIEREAESRSRNGEGQPMVWRDYSQDRSNFDRHTLAAHTTRSMDTQQGYRGGVESLDAAKAPIRRGAAVKQTHGDA